jgi:hypothetical protein
LQVFFLSAFLQESAAEKHKKFSAHQNFQELETYINKSSSTKHKNHREDGELFSGIKKILRHFVFVDIAMSGCSEAEK